MDIEKELAAARREKTEIREQRQDLATREALVDATIEVLERRVSGAEQPKLASRTDRILAVLRRTGALSPSQLTAHLRADEPDLDPKKVRATLNHLRQQGRVDNPSRGRWLASE